MIKIGGGKTETVNTTPKDGIIRCCGQCPYATHDSSRPWDTPNIWKCSHKAYKGYGEVFDGYRFHAYMKGCPIKNEMRNQLRARNKRILK